jgi:hypothetical protein
MTQRVNAATQLTITALARGNDSEHEIKPFYEFERRKKLDGSAVVKECCSAMKKRLSAIKEAATMRM